MKKIFCIGELLIDFVGQTSQGIIKSQQFSKHPGGAPANTAAAIAKLGGSPYFMGQVGNDSFGKYLLSCLKELGIDTSFCKIGGKTTLAFVAIDNLGERDFEFYRGNDGDYQINDLKLDIIDENSIVHFGSATALIGGPLHASYFQLLEYADTQKSYISFDPNYRENLISPDKLPDYLHDCKTFISYANLVKVSEIEAQLISGEDDLTKAASYLLYLGADTVVITLGAKGSLICTPEGQKIVPSKQIQQVDSTGAGDAFMGALLLKLAQHPEPNWDSFLAFANLVGAFTCTNYGAIKSMPTMRQFLEFIS